MPNCDLLLAANTGHWVQWERADFFNAVTLLTTRCIPPAGEQQ